MVLCRENMTMGPDVFPRQFISRVVNGWFWTKNGLWLELDMNGWMAFRKSCSINYRKEQQVVREK